MTALTRASRNPSSRRRTREWAQRAVGQLVAYVLTTALAGVFVVPFLWMVSTSLKSQPDLVRIPPRWIPDPIMWSNYPKAWTAEPFNQFLVNTIVYTLLATTGILLSSSLVAYAFARMEFPGRKWLFILVLSTVMLPSQVTLIPQYLLFRQLGWLDSLKPLVVPAFFGSAIFIFLMRQFFMTIPREIDESALIDGANRWDIFIRIIMPLSKPIVVTIIAFSFVSHWNDFFGPLIYLNRPQSMTLAVGLLLFKGDVDTLFHLLMAASVIVLVPVIVVFFIAQRYFVTSITMTGLREG